ncbi:DUF2188 domain-containing protein [Xanthobacter tagetidis]|uniref:DUF2188 domain-containing protein n=1 Tax=Xanthobacter tagetidis TaxID=60216 RepID=A0A3L7AGK7_9HYPH|nr:DUF2188 domain-containing protein [Xanthobacter tagetidis]
MPAGRLWSVSRSGAGRAVRSYRTRRAALPHARLLAAHEGANLYVFSASGRVEWREPAG